MTYSIANFYDLRQAVAALAAAGCEDNATVYADVEFDVVHEHTVVDDGDIYHDDSSEHHNHCEQVRKIALTRPPGGRPEVVIS